jgi:hypothetical protein
MALTCPIPPAAPATTVRLFVSKLSQGWREGVCWEPRTCFDHIDGVECVVLVSGYRKDVVG